MSQDSSLERMIERSAVVLGEAEYLKDKDAWNMVARRSQESVELALKCALLWAKIEVLRIHDVGPILKQYADRYPEPFRFKILHIASVSRLLRAEREISFYRDEQSGVPPKSLYTRVDVTDCG